MEPVGEELPIVGYRGELKISGIPIQCFVVELKDGQVPLRVLSGRAVTKSLNLTGRGQGMLRFLDNRMLRPHMSAELVKAIQEPVRFMIRRGFVGHGYTADLLPMLCYSIMDAYDERMKSLAMSGHTPGPRDIQLNALYMQAKILARGFSVVGINALVDEATGYQDVRDRLALRAMLDKYLAEEWRKEWARMFPIEFYREIFRLRGWRFDEKSNRRPSFVGHITNDIVYSRIHPELLAELKRGVPKNAQGQPKSKLFMGLSEDYGVPALKHHMEKVILLLEVSTSWPGFLGLLNRKFPPLRKVVEPRKTEPETSLAQSQQYGLFDDWDEEMEEGEAEIHS